jgi:PAS domain S-box-containing protein
MSGTIDRSQGMATLLAGYPWQDTALGAASTWSSSLHTATSICMKSRFPIIIFWGPDLVQIYNDAYTPILGDKHPRAFGQRASDCWPEIWDSIGPMLMGVLETNEATWAENLLLPLHRNGRVEDCYFTFSYSPIDEGERPGGVFCAVTETTATVMRERDARERASALAELDRAKTTFFNNISHELRTPLTLMLGPLSEMEKGADGAQRPMIEIAKRNSLRLLRLVNTLLDFSRIEAGQAEPVFQTTDVARLTEELVSLFRNPIESAGLSLVTAFDLDDPAPIDPAMWEKIVLNLLSNAVKFTLTGEIRVALTRAGDDAQLTVADTGVGIPPDDLPRIFERFHRVRGVDSRSHEGTGIGLALVDELVRLHGGTIDVESRLGSGTAFTVRIPLTNAAVTQAGPAQVRSNTVREYIADVEATSSFLEHDCAADGAATDEYEGRILIVDDNADLRNYMRRLLSSTFNVHLARDGSEALRALRTATFDVVISDVMMPVMDGFELLREIREDAALTATRFIFLSARAGAEAAISGLEHGADDYLAKPFSADDLIARVRSQLRALRREVTSGRRALEQWFERPGDAETNEAAFRVFADQLPIAVFQQDVDGALSFTNNVWHSLLKLPREPASHTLAAWQRVIHPDDITHALAAVSVAITGRDPYELEYRLRPAGSGAEAYRWYIASGVPHYATDGSFRGWTGSLIDVHDSHLREEAERNLRLQAAQGENAFRALADTIPVMVWTATASGWLDWYNQRWFDYTGQTIEEAAGWGWQRAHHTDDFQRVMEEWPACIETGSPFEMEFRLRSNDGEFRYFLTRAVPVRDEDGRITRWYGSCIDIQAQREAHERSKHIAQTLQGVLFSSPLPHTPQLRIDAVYQAAESDMLVGGDWFDAIALPDGRRLLSIGDVTGHGLDASIVAARLRNAIVDFAFEHGDPAAVLDRANRILRLQYPDVYATALVAFIDPDSTQLTYASAGHHPPMLAAEAERPAMSLQLGGTPLGVQDRLELTPHDVAIERDAVVAFYTDGLIEFARDTAPAEVRLAELVAQVVGDTVTRHPARAIRDALLGAAQPTDDLALMIVQFSDASSAAEAPKEPRERSKTWRFHSSDALTTQEFRHELMHFLRLEPCNESALFDSELILGELLANAVAHAPGLIDAAIDWSGDFPLVTIADRGNGRIAGEPHLPADVFAEHGRGLFLVNSLAKHTEIRATAHGGSEIRVVLPLRRTGTGDAFGLH